MMYRVFVFIMWLPALRAFISPTISSHLFTSYSSSPSSFSLASNSNLGPTDLILSSGFLAFGRHAGFLEAIEDLNITPSRIVGTSSGSLAGSLFASGRMKAADISFELSRNAPIQLISSAGLTLHKGLFSLKKLAKHLKTLLPQDFSQLEIPLAVGVIQSSSSRFELISDGDLIDAVVASCAIPYLFQPVIIKGDYYADGGVKDRVGLTPWASWSESARAIVHLVGTSRPAAKTSSSLEEQEGLIAPKDRSLIVVRTPKASANFFSLKDYTAQKNEAYVASMKALLPHSVGL